MPQSQIAVALGAASTLAFFLGSILFGLVWLQTTAVALEPSSMVRRQCSSVVNVKNPASSL
jgi:hypothetical protein